MNEKQLAKLIKQNVAKAEQAAKKKKGKKYDPTLEATSKPEDEGDDVIERSQFFKEMKRREF
ncbi:MAG: hypothetical protein ACJ8AO_13115 [Gemmatimonadaceae bacterium]